MTSPNIGMIESSLRNCSLNTTDQSRSPPLPPHLPDTSDEDADVTVYLNSDAALPYHWEQCLDLMTGEVYYVNWNDGTRTIDDPRASATSYSSDDEYSFDEDSTDDDDDDDEDEDDEGDSTSYSSEVVSGDGETLVAAGCRACFMYFMVPKSDDECPRCGGALLHLGRNGCF